MVRLTYAKADAALYYLKNAEHYLSKERYERFCRLQCENDKLLCLAAGLLLSKTFGKENVKKIRLNQHGKPYIENESYFNLAHSGNYVVLAVDSKPVGVDIEQHRERNFEAIARISFHEKEREQLKRSQDKQQTFYELWTLKESYMKAVGRGFNLPPTSFYFDLSGGIALHADEQERRSFYIHRGIAGYTVALCTQTGCFDGKLLYQAL